MASQNARCSLLLRVVLLNLAPLISAKRRSPFHDLEAEGWKAVFPCSLQPLNSAQEEHRCSHSDHETDRATADHLQPPM